MTKPVLTPDRFDRLAADRSKQPGDPSRIIWTLSAIGQRIGVGTDFVRDTLAQQEGSPVKELGGRYYAFEEDLLHFLRHRGVTSPVHR